MTNRLLGILLIIPLALEIFYGFCSGLFGFDMESGLTVILSLCWIVITCIASYRLIKMKESKVETRGRPRKFPHEIN